MTLPEMSGAETLSRLATTHPELPVLLTTRRSDQTAFDLVASYTKVALLPKPSVASRLEVAIALITSPGR